jgi:hypothetical protein
MTMHCTAGERLRGRDRSRTQSGGQRFAADGDGSGRQIFEAAMDSADTGAQWTGKPRESRGRVGGEGKGCERAKARSGFRTRSQRLAARATGAGRAKRLRRRRRGSARGSRAEERTSVTWPKLEKACWRMSVVVFHERFPAGRREGGRRRRERRRTEEAEQRGSAGPSWSRQSRCHRARLRGRCHEGASAGFQQTAAAQTVAAEQAVTHP